MEERKHTTQENVNEQALWPLEIDFNPARPSEDSRYRAVNKDLDHIDMEAMDIDSRFGRPQISAMPGQTSDFNEIQNSLEPRSEDAMNIDVSAAQ